MESNKVTTSQVADLKKQVAALEEQLEKKTQLVDEIINRVINYTSHNEKSEINSETTASLRLLYGAWLKESRGTSARGQREVSAGRFKGM